jgi:transposase
MAVADRAGLPVSVCIASASPHEATLVQAVLDKRFLAEKPQRLIGDKAYDSDPLDALLAAQGIALIAPHRRNRKREATQDGRVLRRYKRRWKVERLFAWLQQFRRLVVRYEWHDDNFLGMVHLACIKILLKQFKHL